MFLRLVLTQRLSMVPDDLHKFFGATVALASEVGNVSLVTQLGVITGVQFNIIPKTISDPTVSTKKISTKKILDSYPYKAAINLYIMPGVSCKLHIKKAKSPHHRGPSYSDAATGGSADSGGRESRGGGRSPQPAKSASLMLEFDKTRTPRADGGARPKKSRR